MTKPTDQKPIVPIIGTPPVYPLTSQSWYSRGARLPYDFKEKRMLAAGDPRNVDHTLDVFRRSTHQNEGRAHAKLTTFLPGFPDGSVGWRHVDNLLPDEQRMPRVFVEYIGQGDSDKPSTYAHSIVDRADQVEAHWRDLNIQSTFVVAFDYSVIVVLELLSRHQDRLERGEPPVVAIEGVLLINGGLFADGHTHPWFTTPLLKTPFGKIGTWFAQRSRFVFGELVSSLWSKEYGVTTEEVDEMFDAITRRNGARFLSDSAGFVDEHKRNAIRWDLKRLYHKFWHEISFHIVGSAQDPFEGDQTVKAKQRLSADGLDIRVVPGGHLSTSEQPEMLAAIVSELTLGTQTPQALIQA